MKKKTKKPKPVARVAGGFCPKCGHEDLKYWRQIAWDDGVAYRVICPKCRWRGWEKYALTYVGYSVTI